MPKLAKVLSALEVSRLKVAGLHFVGEVPGLALNVAPTGARSWVLRMKVGGRRRDIGLGGYPAVTLAEARGKAREARDGVSKGVETPSSPRRPPGAPWRPVKRPPRRSTSASRRS